MKRSYFSLGKEVLVGLAALTAISLFTGQTKSNAETPESGDHTLSPYFFVKSDDTSVDQLPLKSTSANVNIAGIIADVAVTQTYKNEGRKTLEAVYVFPASTRAAVYGMKMTIGERTITARIEKREQAREAYEQARKEGKTASLLEQQRPNVFQMNVANIQPGDEIRTELRYTELMVPTDGIYEFAYPTVVGPRYSNAPEATAPASEKWTQNPYLHEGETPPNSFDISLRVAAGMDIQDMSCPSHKVNISYKDKNLASVGLDPSEKTGGNRDFILKYRLAGSKIASGLLLLEGQEENFFLLMTEPPERVSQTEIPPREYIFIVDVSGSMHGYPLEISKKLFKDLASNLRPIDTFNVMLFSGGSKLLSEHSLPATPENTRRAVDLISQQQGGGGTELLPAMKRALTLPRTDGVSRTIVIATDGYVSVEPEVFDLMRGLLGNANFFPFGIGTSVNRHLIEGMARVGAGEPFIITKADQAPAMAEKFRRYIQYPLLTQTSINFGGFEAYDVEPAGIPDLFAGRPVIVHGKWRGKPQGVISLTGKTGDRTYEKKIDAGQVAPLPENSALRQLWARARITQLADYNLLRQDDARIGQITDIGLKYSLLTPYTSFVAVDSMVRGKGDGSVTVKQPLPLPQGVSDYSVGAQMAYSMVQPAPAGRGGAPSMLPNVMGSSSTARKEYRVAKPSEQEAPQAPSTKDSSTARVKLLTLKVEGGLSENSVRPFLEQELNSLLECLPRRAGEISGETLSFKLTIAVDGSTRNVVLTWAKGGDKRMKCLREKLLKWKFPSRGSGREVLVEATVSITN
ncbi:MAG: VIT and VWA domain-containing protein [Syntrophobacter sp.]